MIAKVNSIKPISTLAILIALAVWASLCLIALLAVVNLNLRDAERNFTEHGEDYVDKLNRSMVSSETVLKGFSALFAAIGNTNPEKVSVYVKSVIDTNDQIFALEIIQKVAKKQLQDFIVSRRLGGNVDFTVKSFSFGEHRGWMPPQDKPFYYPVIYMESLSSSSKEILGLDVSSVPFLESAVTQAITLRRPVASHPFRLIQGNLAYVVFCPIKSEDNMIVDMIIDASRLQRPSDNLMRDGFSAVVYHTDFTIQDPKGHLFSVSGRARSAIEVKIFPVFKHQKSLATMGEPFLILMTRQAGWTDLSLKLIGLMALLSMVSSAILYIYLCSIQRGRLEHISHQNLLWKLANQDGLTGIPNRMLMLDRLEQALAVSDRNGQYGAVIFLDIDDFKVLNDTKGHDAGDLLLIEVAKRIKHCIRDVDTVARLGGDEFIVILSELGTEFAESNAAANQVADKIQMMVEQPCRLQLFDYQVTVSIGITLFKGSEKTINQLLKSADAAMYQQKAMHHQ
ncbi:sensor domain-containing diguanylate cyclase [Methylotenera sp. L2L1]|uniref:sensor domain-containing diguanylate cyclase n=1 Tax=Methylotenera sp. L2L1 TaxID=1502770 RepID=UPI000AE71FE2|nr:diguanylate cyclase [Methylotenera sp. L2L1]